MATFALILFLWWSALSVKADRCQLMYVMLFLSYSKVFFRREWYRQNCIHPSVASLELNILSARLHQDSFSCV
jgi:hypothetical protein